MTDPENVLARWSRLKRQRDKETKSGAKAPAIPETAAPQRDATDDAKAASFDVANLPPIESIVAGSDIRAFLQAGVPAALTRAALRRAWSSDVAIRDFIGMAENQWDFANPEGIAGFGPLSPSDDISQLVAQALGELRKNPMTIAADYGPENKQTPAHTANPPINAPRIPTPIRGSPPEGENALLSDAKPRASQHDSREADAHSAVTHRKKRRHGGAMPA